MAEVTQDVPNMSSEGVSTTALAGRGFSVSAPTDEYQVVLPSLPRGALALNTVILHCDSKNRPYRIEDFKQELERLNVLKEVASIGAYQMNHVWIVTLRSSAATYRLVSAKELTVKGRRCLVIDPSNAEVRLKIHWIPFHVSNDAVRKAMEPYGKVTEVARETWKAEGFEGIESATRLVRINLKEGTTIDGIPHQLRLFGANSLIVVPGRAPLCLRCKHTGHIRRDCRVPLCSECHRFGHESDDCMKTYATAVGRQEIDPVHELLMDADEAESTAASTAPAALITPGTGGNACPAKEKEVAAGQEKTVAVQNLPLATEVKSIPDPRASETEEKCDLEDQQTKEESPEIVEEMPDASQVNKRPLENVKSLETEDKDLEEEAKWNFVTTKKGRYNAKHRNRQNSQ